MEWYIKCLKNYAVFSGRARRKEHWYFTLFSLIVMLVLYVLEFVVGLLVVLSVIYSFGIIIPSLAVGIRRLHDTGRCGWGMLLNLIPIVGWIVLIVFLASDSEPGDNDYGPNPKELSSSVDEAGDSNSEDT